MYICLLQVLHPVRLPRSIARSAAHRLIPLHVPRAGCCVARFVFDLLLPQLLRYLPAEQNSPLPFLVPMCIDAAKQRSVLAACCVAPGLQPGPSFSL